MNTNLAKTSTPPKHFDFFSRNFSFNFHFFSEHPKFYTYIFFSFSTLWKFSFGHLDFFSHKHLDFFYVITPTLDIFLWLREKLSECSSANNRKSSCQISNVIDITTLQTNWNYSKQYNRIHRYKTHTHTHVFSLVERNISCKLWIQ